MVSLSRAAIVEDATELPVLAGTIDPCAAHPMSISKT
jgi:hypothetical protein